MIRTKNLNHQFDDGTQLKFPDWEVPKGDHALILGPSGCGKTTLLHLLSGLLKPSVGSVEIEGTNITELSASQLDKFRGAHVGFVFQKPHLINSLTVKENILLAGSLAHKPRSSKEVEVVLGRLNIGHLANKKVHQISQGQAQRVTIARAVINEPNVIFGDEPTASLDDQSCEAVVRLLKEQANACKATLVMATHDHRVKSEFSNQLTL